MNILLTGSTGFLGRNVLELLRKSPHTIYTLSHQKDNYKNLVENIIVKKGDISDKSSLIKIKKENLKIDTIIHIAALVPKTKEEDNEILMKKVNENGTKNLLDVFGKELRSIIYTSTSEVYGSALKNKIINERTRPKPISNYAKTKYQGEKIIQSYSERNKIQWIILRYSVMYGYDDPIERAVPNFIKASLQNKEIIIKGGEELRDYIHIKDAAKAILNALDKNISGTFLIGSGKAISIKQTAKEIVKKTKSKSKIRIEMRDKKGFDLLMDISGSQKILNFSPNYFFPEGVDEEIKLMQLGLKKNLS